MDCLVFFRHIGKSDNLEMDLKVIQELNELGVPYDISEDSVWVPLGVWLCSETYTKCVADVMSEEPKNPKYTHHPRVKYKEAGEKWEIKLKTWKEDGELQVLLEYSSKPLEISGWTKIKEGLWPRRPELTFDYYRVTARFISISKNVAQEKKEWWKARRKRQVLDFLGSLVPGVSEERVAMATPGF